MNVLICNEYVKIYEVTFKQNDDTKKKNEYKRNDLTNK